MYDMMYFYNQFIEPLPKTYLEFIYKWNSFFPLTYDSKVCAYANQEIFIKSHLSEVYEKTERDEAFKDLVKFVHDEKNFLTKYMKNSGGPPPQSQQ